MPRIECQEDIEMIFLARSGRINCGAPGDIQSTKDFAIVMECIVSSLAAKIGTTKRNKIFLQAYREQVELAKIFRKMADGKPVTKVEELKGLRFMSNNPIRQLMRDNIDPEELKKADQEIKESIVPQSSTTFIEEEIKSRGDISLVDYYKLYCLNRAAWNNYWREANREVAKRIAEIDRRLAFVPEGADKQIIR